MSYFDDNEDRIIYGRYRAHGPAYDEKLPQCNRCRSYDVRWRQQGGKWVLFSLQPGVEHVCELSADDFGVVP
jgi:hypothetical protein